MGGLPWEFLGMGLVLLVSIGGIFYKVYSSGAKQEKRLNDIKDGLGNMITSIDKSLTKIDTSMAYYKNDLERLNSTVSNVQKELDDVTKTSIMNKERFEHLEKSLYTLENELRELRMKHSYDK